MKTKFLSMIALMLLFIPYIHAQKISGQILQENREPLEYANIIVYQASDTSLYKGAVTELDGSFEIQVVPNDYLVKISMIGFTELSLPIKVTDASQTENIGLQILRIDNTTLDEVTVSAKKVLFEKKADRTTVNVQSNAINRGSSVLEVLSMSPGVTVTNDNITMSGKSNVRVMMNGKIIRLPLDAVISMLDGLSSENVLELELITNPGAEFEAEGNAGFINIKMVKNQDLGTQGRVILGAGWNRGLNANVGANISHRINNFAIDGNYSFSRDHKPAFWDTRTKLITDGDIFQAESYNVRNTATDVHNLNIGLNWNIAPDTEIFASVSGLGRYWLTHDTITGFEKLNGETTSDLDMTVKEINEWTNVSTSIGFSKKIGKQQAVKGFYDYLYYFNDQPTEYHLNEQISGDRTNLFLGKSTPIKIHVLSLDYDAIVSSKLSVKIGAKAVVSNFDNKIDIKEEGNSFTEILDQLASDASMNENVFGAFATANYEIGSKDKLTAGIRYERTITQLHSNIEKNLVDRNFGNWFPNINYTHQFNTDHTVVVALNSRITRPTYTDLAPFVFFTSPTVLIQGNSTLFPASTYGLDATYIYKKYWLSLKYNRVLNGILGFQPSVSDADQFTVWSPQNVPLNNSYVAELTVPIQAADWWTINNTVTGLRNDLFFDELDGVFTQYNFVVNHSQAINLPKSNSINIGVNYMHNNFWGVTSFKPIFMVNAGWNKGFSNGANLSFRVTDLFKRYIWKLEYITPTNEYNADLDFSVRSVDMTFSYPFGNSKLKKVNIESGSSTERNRVNF